MDALSTPRKSLSDTTATADQSIATTGRHPPVAVTEITTVQAAAIILTEDTTLVVAATTQDIVAAADPALTDITTADLDYVSHTEDNYGGFPPAIRSYVARGFKRKSLLI